MAARVRGGLGSGTVTPAGRDPLTTYVALLRGINVGGKNQVPMPALRATVESLGHEDVQTYIQSGNVVFKSRSRSVPRITSALQTAVAKEFDLPVSVVVRTPRELERAAGANPYLAAGADPSSLHVVFLGSSPTKASVKALDPDRSPPDEFAVGHAEVYLHCPHGIGRSKLTVDYFERTLGGPATIRNWKTVTKLLELVS
jgi:uncharacterized protein (DUF1697 family)